MKYILLAIIFALLSERAATYDDMFLSIVYFFATIGTIIWAITDAMEKEDKK